MHRPGAVKEVFTNGQPNLRLPRAHLEMRLKERIDRRRHVHALKFSKMLGSIGHALVVPRIAAPQKAHPTECAGYSSSAQGSEGCQSPRAKKQPSESSSQVEPVSLEKTMFLASTVPGSTAQTP